MGVEAQSPPLTGKMLGRYRILSRLAVGGMAELWLALASSAKGETQKVVLKTMLPGVAESREFVRMFQTEATIGSRLRHANLVKVLDYGRLADRYFIAMEYIDGLTLRQVGQRLHDMGSKMPRRLLLSIAIEVCRGLHSAHELRDRGGLLQFVHRDVSPENIMITRDGVAKLIDFGAALTLRIPPTTARFVGKFRYVAPERIDGKKEDRRSDIYSIGVILYEYLTGVRPYEGDNMAMVSRILEGKPRPPSELVSDLPPALEPIILKALSLQPGDRYPTAAALAADLVPLVEALTAPGSADRVATVDQDKQLLARAFDRQDSNDGGQTEPATPTETDTKTVEMEVDALKEVLSRTRDDTTAVRRMIRGERRGRTQVGEPRSGNVRAGRPRRSTKVAPSPSPSAGETTALPGANGGHASMATTPPPVRIVPPPSPFEPEEETVEVVIPPSLASLMELEAVLTLEPARPAASEAAPANESHPPIAPADTDLPQPVRAAPGTMDGAEVQALDAEANTRPIDITPAAPAAEPAPPAPEAVSPSAEAAAAPAPSVSAAAPVSPSYLFEQRQRSSVVSGLFDDHAPPPAARLFGERPPVMPVGVFDDRAPVVAEPVFGERAPAAPEPVFGDRAPALPSGWFDIRRPEAAPSAAQAEQSGPLDSNRRRPAEPVAEAEPPALTRRAPIPEAVRCFDRGLSLLQDRLFAAALDEWERAAALDPDNRMYQVNLKRLRTRVSNVNQPQPEERP